eukprot:11576238-Alexandrium_andersonii.AAC.1
MAARKQSCEDARMKGRARARTQEAARYMGGAAPKPSSARPTCIRVRRALTRNDTHTDTTTLHIALEKRRAQ